MAPLKAWGGPPSDLGWNDLGYQRGALPGQENAIDSPHLDALALGGVRLFDYAVFKFCSPSRSHSPLRPRLGPPRGIARGAHGIFTVVNPYGTYFLGLYNILGGPNRECRQFLTGRCA